MLLWHAAISHIHTIVHYLKTLKQFPVGGGVHAVAQAVCRWSPRTGIGPRPVHVGLMVGKVAEGQVSARVIACYYHSTDVSNSFCSRMTDVIKYQQ